ncbi:bacteriochlorophyll 4-vinyl reductase [Lutimaribacter sp. EGI FJ00015]|uniref:Bacteriochlorophyll 4-vinyl reductase n=1 Tax=Lutimaribacter degradans TaxID=2945989 RepID=A0ACC5ZQC9_9RHOB|nr:bacteriochlorophyll 4-vinyl reductase [Lutimaribacter sp. EGI FJ00013]MCM2560524.1 bacteriochlorophyll 4-vinyl reductase [Lutimaribacter sp. EGI FJ00013]MCO0612532.1 bacteriochlorophyll 4-vinyl reductase [Lutimaribacter sp. EGI FJ00015]MCO0634348.1 bacteriochlorophyll 4-vinyl reductase [Lutimaribacter sp. EGI FJ00014]
MLDHSGLSGGRIGPNALMQLAPVLDRDVGVDARHALFAAHGLMEVPDGRVMIDEALVAAIHQDMRLRHPEHARAMARAAGLATGDYLLDNRIPASARRLLRTLPAPLAARVLTRAITAHAWTFCGTGHLTARPGHPTVFDITANPVVRGEIRPRPVCDWHAAVFERLFTALVHHRARVREVTCCAMGHAACRFELRWRRHPTGRKSLHTLRDGQEQTV